METTETSRKLPCSGCGLPAPIDCQHTCDYIFAERRGRADIVTKLPIQYDANHQFDIRVEVAVEGRNFGKKAPRTFRFNSVRCAELFLIERGYAQGTKKDATIIGSGERLLRFLGGSEIVKARKNRRSLEYKQAQLRHRGLPPVAHSTTVCVNC